MSDRPPQQPAQSLANIRIDNVDVEALNDALDKLFGASEQPPEEMQESLSMLKKVVDVALPRESLYAPLVPPFTQDEVGAYASMYAVAVTNAVATLSKLMENAAESCFNGTTEACSKAFRLGMAILSLTRTLVHGISVKVLAAISLGLTMPVNKMAEATFGKYVILPLSFEHGEKRKKGEEEGE